MPSGIVISAPRPPMPPALATAMARLAGQAPAIGACRIGTRSPKRSQNASARLRADPCCDISYTSFSAREDRGGAALHFRRRAEGEQIGRDAHGGREFERVEPGARKGQLDKVGGPAPLRLGRFGDVDAIARMFHRRAAVGGTDSFEPEIASRRVYRLP